MTSCFCESRWCSRASCFFSNKKKHSKCIASSSSSFPSVYSFIRMFSVLQILILKDSFLHFLLWSYYRFWPLCFDLNVWMFAICKIAKKESDDGNDIISFFCFVKQNHNPLIILDSTNKQTLVPLSSTKHTHTHIWPQFTHLDTYDLIFIMAGKQAISSGHNQSQNHHHRNKSTDSQKWISLSLSIHMYLTVDDMFIVFIIIIIIIVVVCLLLSKKSSKKELLHYMVENQSNTE